MTNNVALRESRLVDRHSRPRLAGCNLRQSARACIVKKLVAHFRNQIKKIHSRSPYRDPSLLFPLQRTCVAGNRPYGMTSQRSVQRPSSSETIEKRSRFVATVAPAATVDDANAVISMLREVKASHNCWAYRIDESTYRYSDDGEPCGTAGAPIYKALCFANVVNAVIVVTRFYGGIKLGASGLSRAYSSAASNCLRLAPLVRCEPMVHVRVAVPFNYIGALFVLAAAYERVEATYLDDQCEVALRIPEQERQSFEAKVREVTHGRGSVEIVK